jgi:hypothetical protein
VIPHPQSKNVEIVGGPSANVVSSISDRAKKLTEDCKKATKDHDDSSYRWRKGAEALAWITAVLAALSGLAVVSDNSTVAPFLAIATAFAAATNAALNPAETARRHRSSALDFARLRVKVEDFQDEMRVVPDEGLPKIRETFRKLNEEYGDYQVASPPIRGI